MAENTICCITIARQSLLLRRQTLMLQASAFNSATITTKQALMAPTERLH